MLNLDPNQVDAWQKDRQKMFKSVPTKGRVISYLGKDFLVYKNTFWPFQDSQPLVKHFRMNKGDRVLDIGTGSGVIAIFACYKGAGRVVAVDINPWAVKSARENAKRHGFNEVMEVVQGDVFSSIKKEKFDVITANLPFRNKPAPNLVARSQWDTDFATNKKFLARAAKHLKRDGRIYLSHANFGSVETLKLLAKSAGFSIRKIAEEHKIPKGDEIFYAFVLKRASRNE